MKPAFKISAAEQKRRNQRTIDMYAALAERPTVQLAPVREKRAAAPKLPGQSSEHAEQVAVIQWWRNACGTYGLPPFALLAIPNGGHLAGGAISANRLKAEGMRPGVLDLFLAVPKNGYGGVWVEMKYGKNKMSAEQVVFAAFANTSGYVARPYWSSGDAIDAIKSYLA